MRWPAPGFAAESRALAFALSGVAVALLMAGAIRALIRHRFVAAAHTPGEADDWVLDLANRTRLWLLFFPLLAVATAGMAMSADLTRRPATSAVTSKPRLSIATSTATVQGATREAIRKA